MDGQHTGKGMKITENVICHMAQIKEENFDVDTYPHVGQIK